MKFVYAMMIVALLMIVFTVTAKAREFNWVGIPEPVTVTSTDLALGSYTKVLDSDLSCSQFFLTNMDASQNVTVTYNATNPYDDYVIVKPGITIERDGATPDGVYCGVTATAGAVNVSVRYESWK